MGHERAMPNRKRVLKALRPSHFGSDAALELREMFAVFTTRFCGLFRVGINIIQKVKRGCDQPFGCIYLVCLHEIHCMQMENIHGIALELPVQLVHACMGESMLNVLSGSIYNVLHASVQCVNFCYKMHVRYRLG